MALDLIYTGREHGVKLPTGERINQGERSLSNFIARAEDIKYKAFKENEQEFLKASNIDPVFLISDKSQKVQSQLLDDFNKKWAGEYKRYQGNLPVDVKQQMQSEKNILLAIQQKMQSDMERAMVDRDIVSKDVAGNIDHEDANARWADYVTTGNYDISPLKPSAIDPDLQYSRNINKGVGTKSTVTITKKKDGVLVTEKKIASGTEEEGRKFVEADILGNPRLAQGYIKKFKALKTNDPETYVKYLDTDLSGTVDTSEEQAASTSSNPIIKWAQDNYWDKKLILEDVEVTKPETVKTTFDWELGVGIDNNKNTQFAKNNDITIQRLPPYKNFYDLQLGSVPSVIQKVGDYVDASTGEKKTLNKAINMKIVGYSPDGDKLIVNVEDDVYPAKGEPKTNLLLKDTKIELDASLYDALLKAKPYGFSREKAMAESGATAPKSKGLLD
jgi:hypothetical protein